MLVLFLGPGVRHRPGRQVPADRAADRWSARCCGCRTRSRWPRFGGRNWTIVSALLLLVPTVADRRSCCKPGVSLHHPAGRGRARRRRRRQLRLVDDEHQRLLPAAAQGLGARAQRRRRQPRRRRGPAGRPAGAGHRRRRRTRGCVLAIYIPLIVARRARRRAAAWTTSPRCRNEQAARMRDVAREPHTWIMSLLYIGTFGSFIGFSFAFGQVLQVQFTPTFATPVKAAVPDLPRPAARLADPAGRRLRWPTGSAARGSRSWNFVAMAAGAGDRAGRLAGSSRCRCSSSASSRCSSSAASATARRTR